MANKKRLVDVDHLQNRFRIVAQSGGPVVYHVSDICATIEDEAVEESVDAAPVVHGQWECYSTTMMECSVCKRHTARHRYKYCPHCGAVMEDKFYGETD